MTLRVRLAAAFGLVALLTALLVAVTAPTIVGRGFAAMAAGDASPGMGQGPGQGPGPGPNAGLHLQQVQQETSVTLIVDALAAAGLASLLGLLMAGRLTRPFGRLQAAAAAVAQGQLSARSGLAGRHDELGSLGRSFDAMAAELEGSEAARRRFFQDVAHELKTPLAVIDATTSAVIDGVYEHDNRHLQTIRDQSRLLARIVDDLRTISLAESGALVLRPEPVAVAALLASVARDMQARATAARQRIDVQVHDGITVRADPDRLRQVVAALVDNALRHTPAGGWVQMQAEQRLATGGAAAGPGAEPAPLAAPVERVVLTVTDSGPGIAPDDLPHVFERFYRADPARDRATGSSGLGLAIVRAVVEAHGGRVRAMNVPGGGARMEVELPTNGPPVAERPALPPGSASDHA